MHSKFNVSYFQNYGPKLDYFLKAIECFRALFKLNWNFNHVFCKPCNFPEFVMHQNNYFNELPEKVVIVVFLGCQRNAFPEN